MAAYRDANSTAPAHGAVAVTPNDSTIFPVTRALYLATAGAITVRMADGMTVTYPSVDAGIFPIQVDMVLDTGTDAITILALY
jgi:hypothetical protein